MADITPAEESNKQWPPHHRVSAVTREEDVQLRRRAGFMVPGGLYYFKNGIRPNAAM